MLSSGAGLLKPKNEAPPVTAELQARVRQMISEADQVDLIPLTIPLNGRPMNIRKARPMFTPLFRKEPLARRQMFLCGRQIGKTVSAAAAATMNLLWRFMFKVLYVAPLALYTNRLHHLYMGAMTRGHLLPWAIQDRHCVNNVLEKTFLTGGHFHGVSCFNSAGNAIGIPTDLNIYDEVQDLNMEFLPQIRETLGNSDFRYEMFFGTARGIDNTIQQLFDDSTQSEFAVKCDACGHWNIPSKDRDAIGMIQRHGIACAKVHNRPGKKGTCGNLLDVERGKWVHAYPDRAKDFIGWHVPQTIVKARIQPYDKYVDTIYSKLHGTLRYSEAKFLQEVLGISTEQGNLPITRKDILEASVLDLGPGIPIPQNQYSHFAGGADWGGSEIISFTVGTIVGWHAQSGSFHCVGALRPTGIPDNERHIPLAHFYKNTITRGRLQFIGADAGFVGTVQNKNLEREANIPVGSIYYGSQKKFFVPYPNNMFTVDRTTMLHVIFSLIKAKRLLFPKGEFFEEFTQDLLTTFIEEIDRPDGTIQKYAKYESKADDFLHALAYGVFMCALAHGGIDLPEMIGIGKGSSVTAGYIGDIGFETGFARGGIPH